MYLSIVLAINWCAVFYEAVSSSGCEKRCMDHGKKLNEMLSIVDYLTVNEFRHSVRIFIYRMETSGPTSALDALRKVSWFVSYFYCCKLELFNICYVVLFNVMRIFTQLQYTEANMICYYNAYKRKW